MPPDGTYDAAAITQPPAPTQAQIKRAITGLMLVLALASLDGNIVGPALPRIVSDLGGLSHLSWVVTVFALASTASTPLYGKLSDQFGRRPAFFVSIGLFLFGSILCGAANSMLFLIAARALQGIGAGGLMTLSQTTIADLIAPRERGRYQGMVAAVFALCSIAGPLLGGFITDTLSWPWIFYINLPVGAAALIMLSTSLRPRPTQRARGIDLPGFTLLIGGTCAALLMLSWGGSAYPWNSPQVIGAGTLALLMFAALIPIERRAPEPALPPVLFANPIFLVSTIVLGLSTAALFGSLVFIPLYFQLVQGASATEAGLRMAPIMAGMIVSSIIGGRLVTRTGRYKIFPVIGLALATPTYAAMAWCARTAAAPNLFDIGLVALGLGLGLIMPNLTTAVQSCVNPAQVGVATSTLSFFRSLGGALGVAVAGAILAANLHARVPATLGSHAINLGLDELRALPAATQAQMLGAYEHALAIIFIAASLLALAAFITVLFLPERPLRSHPT